MAALPSSLSGSLFMSRVTCALVLAFESEKELRLDKREVRNGGALFPADPGGGHPPSHLFSSHIDPTARTTPQQERHVSNIPSKSVPWRKARWHVMSCCSHVSAKKRSLWPPGACPPQQPPLHLHPIHRYSSITPSPTPIRSHKPSSQPPSYISSYCWNIYCFVLYNK